ncbi:MAG: aspartate kinase [Planctomycetota bacterium]|nr:aspartate kinase [Planctomycetota bacterium]
MKFGGSCLQSREGLLRMTELIRSEPRPLIIVLSALKGVTDALLALTEEAGRGATPDVGPLRRRHAEVLEVLRGAPRATAERETGALLDELERTLGGIAAVGEVPDRTRDRVLGLGERLSVVLARAHLEQEGIPAELHVGAAAGMLTTDEPGDARLLPRAAELMRARFAGDRDVVHVVPGFVGQDEAGRWTTLGRGGSDTTATALAGALGGVAILWKDTTGLLTADPRVVDDPLVIDRAHYLDALELAHYGLPAIAEKAIQPARRAGVPIEIRSFLDGAAPSLIGDVATTRLAITCVPEVVMIDLRDPGEDLSQERPDAPEPGPGRVLHGIARFLDALAEAGVLPLVFTEASPAGEATVAIKAKHRATVERALARLRGGLDVQVRDGYAAVSLIGSCMRGRIGFAASVFACLAAEGINIDAIAQTASERNISVVVARDQAHAAVRALHRRFVTSEE